MLPLPRVEGFKLINGQPLSIKAQAFFLMEILHEVPYQFDECEAFAKQELRYTEVNQALKAGALSAENLLDALYKLAEDSLKIGPVKFVQTFNSELLPNIVKKATEPSFEGIKLNK